MTAPRLRVIPASAATVTVTRRGEVLPLFSDAGLSSAVAQPVTITAPVTWYVPTRGRADVVAAAGDGSPLAAVMTQLEVDAVASVQLPVPTGPVRADTWDAHTVMVSGADNSPAPVTLAEGTLLGRATGGDVAALTAAQAQGVLFSSVAGSETASLGAELATGSGWTLGAGWSGDWATGFTHTSGGGTAALTWAPGFSTGTKTYMVEFTVDSVTNSSAFTVTLGGSFGMVMYEGATGGTHTYSRGIASVSDGDLVFTPESAFDGRVYAVSVREVTSSTPATAAWSDSAGGATMEVRPGPANLRNTFIGYEAGRFNVTGHENVGIGDGTMRVSTSGFWNVAVGRQALEANTCGTRNVGLGYTALQSNITGHRNIAIGPFCLRANTHGINNIALGADTLWVNKTGNYNIAAGLAALSSSVTGDRNIAIGTAALALSNGVSDSVAIGDNALAYQVNPSVPSVAVGTHALRYATGGSNVAVGHQALAALTTGVRNVAVGYRAGNSVTTVHDNVAIGDNALQLVTGERNTAFGTSAIAGSAGSTAKRNTAIGYGAGTALASSGDNNVFIGHLAGYQTTSGASNILIGSGVTTPTATTSNHLNIGNTIYGDVSTKRVGINVASPTAKLHLPASTTAASTAPIKIDTGVLMATPEAGAIEFDGTDLYFTTSGGVRKTITAA